MTVPAIHLLPERIQSKLVVTSSGCWEWQGYRDKNGYGKIRVGSKTDGTRTTTLVHRVTYELLVGPINPDREIDHLCCNRPCANPAHMEQVTHQENLRRGDTVAAHSAAKTHCPQGHPYSGDNVGRAGRKQARYCKACKKVSNAKRSAA
jgi:hypothetical protein